MFRLPNNCTVTAILLQASDRCCCAISYSALVQILPNGGMLLSCSLDYNMDILGACLEEEKKMKKKEDEEENKRRKNTKKNT